MADPQRLDAVLDDAADRDGRAESLLVDGLDQYFAGRYEDAIHLWTRVLFLDRSHQRARAYIDRARTAIAERQRRADEMLQATGDLVSEGKTVAARELLNRAIATIGDDHRAADMRARLERVERARPDAAPARQAVVDAVPIRGTGFAVRWPLVSGLMTAGALVIASVALGRAWGWIGAQTPATALSLVTRPVERPVLSTSDVALVRARTLYARGRLAEALRALDRVESGEMRQDADRLRTEIQQLLLATGRGASTDVGSDRGRP